MTNSVKVHNTSHIIEYLIKNYSLFRSEQLLETYMECCLILKFLLTQKLIGLFSANIMKIVCLHFLAFALILLSRTVLFFKGIITGFHNL